MPEDANKQAQTLIELLENNDSVQLSPNVLRKLLILLKDDDEYTFYIRSIYVLRKYYDDPETDDNRFDKKIIPANALDETRVSLKLRGLLRDSNWFEYQIQNKLYIVTKEGVKFLQKSEYQGQFTLPQPKQELLQERVIINEFPKE